jgi:Protein of unknown function (DUF3431)
MITYVISNSNYNDLSWTNSLKKCIIYNKSDSIPESTHPVISLPNIGKEGHTYLHHIITHYDHLDDYTIFLQGNPFNHSSSLEITLKYLEKNIYQNNFYIPFQYISEHIIKSSIKENDEYRMSLCYYILFGPISYQHMIENNLPFVFGTGSQFIVSKKNILSRPKSFYEKIIKLLDYDSNPLENYAIERFWNMIFTHSEL